MHKAGFVNIVGNPNVGKSTLMNLLVGEKISIATFKAQTTRHRIMGIVNTDDSQIVFSDTPGVLKPNYRLQESMLAFSESALVDADVLLYMTDVVEKADKNAEFLEKVSHIDDAVDHAVIVLGADLCVFEIILCLKEMGDSCKANAVAVMTGYIFSLFESNNVAERQAMPLKIGGTMDVEGVIKAVQFFFGRSVFRK